MQRSLATFLSYDELVMHPSTLARNAASLVVFAAPLLSLQRRGRPSPGGALPLTDEVAAAPIGLIWGCGPP